MAGPELCNAAANGDTAVALPLPAAADADPKIIDSANKWGRTALMGAADGGRHEFVKILLEKRRCRDWRRLGR